MGDSQVRCPHCGGLIKLIPQREKRQPAPTKRGVMDSTQKYNVPHGGLRSFFWFMRGNRVEESEPEQPVQQSVTVRAIVRQGHTMRIAEFDDSITYEELLQMAYHYLNQDKWSRRFFKRKMGMGQDRYQLIYDEFVRFGYLRKNGNQNIMTPTGKAFLRGLVNMQTTNH